MNLTETKRTQSLKLMDLSREYTYTHFLAEILITHVL